jgi:nucleoside-diphosphate-sugar epimerase
MMKILFIGGTGTISTHCTQLALQKGYGVTLLNRGQTERQPVPAGANVIHADIRNPEEVERALEGQTFDAVVDWIAFSPSHIENDIRLFKGKTAQFIFISSASIYQSPAAHPIVTESTPLINPFWEYSRNKIACEEMLNRAYRDEGFPITIVRPSHTYDLSIPVAVGGGAYTVADRMLRGQKVIVHGDGTSLWTLTHSEDFAKGFVGLLGHTQALGHAFHITSDEALTWNQIYETIGQALGVEPDIIHIPSDFIALLDAGTGAGLLGDKAKSVIFDNSKIKRFVPEYVTTIPFREGVRRAVRWLDANPTRKTVDAKSNEMMDKCIAAYQKGLDAAKV